jgi:hypothetical protein
MADSTIQDTRDPASERQRAVIREVEEILSILDSAAARLAAVKLQMRTDAADEGRKVQP